MEYTTSVHLDQPVRIGLACSEWTNITSTSSDSLGHVNWASATRHFDRHTRPASRRRHPRSRSGRLRCNRRAAVVHRAHRGHLRRRPAATGASARDRRRSRRPNHRPRRSRFPRRLHGRATRRATTDFPRHRRCPRRRCAVPTRRQHHSRPREPDAVVHRPHRFRRGARMRGILRISGIRGRSHDPDCSSASPSRNRLRSNASRCGGRSRFRIDPAATHKSRQCDRSDAST